MEDGIDREDFSVADLFESLFPKALVYGMSPSQYWSDDPGLFEIYRMAYDEKRELTNFDSWLNGLYTYLAIGKNAPILNAFSKSTKADDYLDSPLEIYTSTAQRDERDKRAESERKHQEELMHMKAIAHLQDFADQFNNPN